MRELWLFFLTHSWEYKGIHAFLKGISPRVNVIARREFELTSRLQSSISAPEIPSKIHLTILRNKSLFRSFLQNMHKHRLRTSKSNTFFSHLEQLLEI